MDQTAGSKMNPKMIIGVIIAIVLVAVGIWAAVKYGGGSPPPPPPPPPPPVTPPPPPPQLQTPPPPPFVPSGTPGPVPSAPVPVPVPVPVQPKWPDPNTLSSSVRGSIDMVRWHFTRPGGWLFNRDDGNAMLAFSRMRTLRTFTLSDLRGPTDGRPSVPMPPGSDGVTFTYNGFEYFDGGNPTSGMIWVSFSPSNITFPEHCTATFTF